MSNLPRETLQKAISQFADNVTRVESAVRRMETELEPVDDPSGRSDWCEVQQLCDFVAAASDAAGYPQIAEHARRVSHLAAQAETRSLASEELIRLIGMCGPIRLADDLASTTSAHPLT